MSDTLRGRCPVIVGVGEVTEKPADLTQGRDSLSLMADALRTANADAGGGFLQNLDSLDVIRSRAWGYRDLPSQLCARLGITPRRAVFGPGGGDRPTLELHRAALAIAQGNYDVAAVCGGESQWTVDRAARANIQLPWSADDRSALPVRNRKDTLHPIAWKYGLHEPAHVYPLYENAVQPSWGVTPRAARRQSAELWAQYSSVAATHPNAWLKQAHGADEIEIASKSNRPIAWPYLKLMVAQPSVNFGGAVIVTSYALAKSKGVPDEKLIFFHAGAAAREPVQYLERDRFDRTPPAQVAVLRKLQRDQNGSTSQFDFVDLYSCFPIVPKMARRILQWPADQVSTVTGGLTFFGGPLNNYMTHATVAMVGRLRGRRGSTGLLYGQGGYLTTHHGLVLSSSAPSSELPADFDVNTDAERVRDPVPPIVERPHGDVQIETFTVLFDRSGEPESGVIIGRDRDGCRLMAAVPAGDAATISKLLNPDQSPIGIWGMCSIDDSGLNTWKPKPPG
jgi:acetyl-CoA C-acetyltransferase